MKKCFFLLFIILLWCAGCKKQSSTLDTGNKNRGNSSSASQAKMKNPELKTGDFFSGYPMLFRINNLNNSIYYLDKSTANRKTMLVEFYSMEGIQFGIIELYPWDEQFREYFGEFTFKIDGVSAFKETGKRSAWSNKPEFVNYEFANPGKGIIANALIHQEYAPWFESSFKFIN